MNLLWKFAIALAVAAAFYGIQQGREAHSALCTYVSDLTQRRDTAQGYLHDQKGDTIVIPTVRVNGKPLQVTRGQLQRDVNAQTRVIRAYDGLDCKEA